MEGRLRAGCPRAQGLAADIRHPSPYPCHPVLSVVKFALQKFVSGLMRGQLDEFELNQKSGVRPNHCGSSSTFQPRSPSAAATLAQTG
jgi:hypothetical protein